MARNENIAYPSIYGVYYFSQEYGISKQYCLTGDESNAREIVGVLNQFATPGVEFGYKKFTDVLDNENS
jgi:hypothetical protein